MIVIIAFLVFAPIAVVGFWLLSMISLNSGMKSMQRASSNIKDIKSQISEAKHEKFAQDFWDTHTLTETNQIETMLEYRAQYNDKYGVVLALENMKIMEEDRHFICKN